MNVTSEKILQEKSENKDIKRKLLRQVEASMRTHDFQKELLEFIIKVKILIFLIIQMVLIMDVLQMEE